MQQHTTSELIDHLAHIIYDLGWPIVIPIIILALVLMALVRVLRLIFKIPILTWIFGYIIYKRTSNKDKQPKWKQ